MRSVCIYMDCIRTNTIYIDCMAQASGAAPCPPTRAAYHSAHGLYMNCIWLYMVVYGLCALYMGMCTLLWTIYALYIGCMPHRGLFIHCVGSVWTLHGPYMAMYGLCWLYVGPYGSIWTVYTLNIDCGMPPHLCLYMDDGLQQGSYNLLQQPTPRHMDQPWLQQAAPN